MMSLYVDTKTDIIEAFHSTSRYLDDFMNIDNPYFEGKVIQIYSTEMQLNKANSTGIETTCLDSHSLISNVSHFKFMTNAMISNFKLLISRFWIAKFLVHPPVAIKCLSSSVLQECLVIWLTSVLIANL